MRSAFACRRTSGPWVSYQYLWNSSRERLGRRRRGKTSFSIGNLLGRHWTAALLDREVLRRPGGGPQRGARGHLTVGRPREEGHALPPHRRPPGAPAVGCSLGGPP